MTSPRTVLFYRFPQSLVDRLAVTLQVMVETLRLEQSQTLLDAHILQADCILVEDATDHTIEQALTLQIPVIVLQSTIDPLRAQQLLGMGCADVLAQQYLDLLPQILFRILYAPKPITPDEHFHQFFINHPLPMWMFDRDTLAFLSVNEAAVRKYGYSYEEFLTMTIKDIRPPEHIDALMDKVKHNRPIWERSRSWMSLGEWQHLLKDGTLIEVEIISRIITIAGKEVVLVVANDITEIVQAHRELEKSEAWFRAIIDNAPVSILISNSQGQFVDVNTRTVEKLGYSREELLSMTTGNLIPAHRVAQAQNYISELLAGKSLRFEREWAKKDGSIVPVQVAARMIADDRFLTVAQDITALKQAQARTNLLLDLLHVTNDAPDLLIALQNTLDLLCQNSDWSYGEVWIPDHDRGVMASSSVHYIKAEHRQRFEEFRIFTDGLVFSPGSGFPGMVWETREVIWNPDVLAIMEPEFLRRPQAKSVGLHSVMAVPIVEREEVLAVMLFASLNHLAEDAPDRELISAAAFQLGSVIRRKQAEDALRRSHIGLEQRVKERTAEVLRAKESVETILNSSQDAIFIVNQNGELEQTNPAFYEMFGAEEDAYFGMPLQAIAEPQSQHFLLSALAHLRQSGNAVSGLEIRALRTSGTIFDAQIDLSPMRTSDPARMGSAVCILHDITERKQVELELRRMHDQLQTILDNAPTMIFIKDRELRYTLVNKSFSHMLNIPPEAIIGKTDAELFGSASDEFNRTDQQVLDQNRTISIEDSIKIDGTTRTFLTVKFPLRDPQGQPYAICGIATDITDRVRAETALRNAEERLRILFDNVPEAITLLDLDGIYIDANPTSLEWSGYSREQIIGTNAFDIGLMSPDDYERAMQGLELTRNGISNTYEFELTRLDGSVFTAEVMTHPVTIEGDILHLSIARDITERRKAEEALRDSEAKYRELIATMQQGFAMFDVDEHITYVNDRFCELVGYPREELLTMTSFDLLEAEGKIITEEQILRRQAGDKSTYEINIRKKDGSRLVLLVSAAPLFDKSGKYTGSFSVSSDITPHKNAEEALEGALQQQREINVMKTRLVSMASHEFRTPLAVIQLVSETLSNYRHRLSDEQIDQRLEKIRTQIHHLTVLVDEILLFGRMDSGRQDISLLDTNFDEFCAGIVDEFRSRIDVSHIIEYECLLPDVHIPLDQTLFRKAFTNLISNAIKYSPHGTKIHVRIDLHDNQICLQVQDHGIGIPLEDQGRLFEAFHRASNVGQTPGTGLGLAITRQAVEAHRGSITFESISGEGTTFMVHLPLFA